MDDTKDSDSASLQEGQKGPAALCPGCDCVREQCDCEGCPKGPEAHEVGTLRWTHLICGACETDLHGEDGVLVPSSEVPECTKCKPLRDRLTSAQPAAGPSNPPAVLKDTQAPEGHEPPVPGWLYPTLRCALSAVKLSSQKEWPADSCELLSEAEEMLWSALHDPPPEIPPTPSQEDTDKTGRAATRGAPDAGGTLLGPLWTDAAAAVLGGFQRDHATRREGRFDTTPCQCKPCGQADRLLTQWRQVTSEQPTAGPSPSIPASPVPAPSGSAEERVAKLDLTGNRWLRERIATAIRAAEDAAYARGQAAGQREAAELLERLGYNSNDSHPSAAIREQLLKTEGAAKAARPLPADRCDCPECGPGVRVDEDHLCWSCGRSCVEVEGGLPIGPLREVYASAAYARGRKELEFALRAAPHALLCASNTITEGRFPTARGDPPQTIRPRQPPDESLCDCWKARALAGTGAQPPSSLNKESIPGATLTDPVITREKSK